MKWFKFYAQDFLSDTKMSHLLPLEQLAWIYCMALAAVEEKDGLIPFCKEETIKLKMGILPTDDGWKSLKGIFKIFKNMNMIEFTPRGTHVGNHVGIALTHFRGRQGANLTPSEKMARYRAKKESNESYPSEVTKVTLDKSRVDKNRTDKTYGGMFEEFWKEYPPRRKQDKPKCAKKFSTFESEGLAPVIIADVIDRKLRHCDWVKNNGEFVPAPLVYLNNRRWEAPIVEGETHARSAGSTVLDA